MRSAAVTITLLIGSSAVAATPPWQRTESHQPCTSFDPLRSPYFGDLHIHTHFSTDAYIFNTQSTHPTHTASRTTPRSRSPTTTRHRHKTPRSTARSTSPRSPITRSSSTKYYCTTHPNHSSTTTHCTCCSDNRSHPTSRPS